MENWVLSKALWLEEPWYVSYSNLDIETWRYDIWIEFRKWAKFEINGKMYWVYQTREREIKHLFMWQYETFLQVKLPIVKTDDWRVITMDCPIMRSYSNYTYHLEWLVLDMAKHMTIKKIAEQIKIHEHSVMWIVKHYVDYSRSKADYEKLTKLWVDETSRKKWHNYITLGVNLETHKVSSIWEWKWKEAVEWIKEEIEAHNWDALNVTHVSMDMSKSFIAWVNVYFPNANIVFDKFHVIKMMLEVLDDVRRKEAKEQVLLRWSKYLWLYNPDKLDVTQKKELEAMMSQNKSLATVYQLKENLKTFYNFTSEEKAENYLKIRCNTAISTKIPVVMEFVKTIKRHWKWILNHIETNITNWVLEWINSIVQLIKRRARWYTNIDNLKAMIYLLKWDFPIIPPTY